MKKQKISRKTSKRTPPAAQPIETVLDVAEAFEASAKRIIDHAIDRWSKAAEERNERMFEKLAAEMPKMLASMLLPVRGGEASTPSKTPRPDLRILRERAKAPEQPEAPEVTEAVAPETVAGGSANGVEDPGPGPDAAS